MNWSRWIEIQGLPTRPPRTLACGRARLCCPGPHGISASTRTGEARRLGEPPRRAQPAAGRPLDRPDVPDGLGRHPADGAAHRRRGLFQRGAARFRSRLRPAAVLGPALPADRSGARRGLSAASRASDHRRPGGERRDGGRCRGGACRPPRGDAGALPQRLLSRGAALLPAQRPALSRRARARGNERPADQGAAAADRARRRPDPARPDGDPQPRHRAGRRQGSDRRRPRAQQDGGGGAQPGGRTGRPPLLAHIAGPGRPQGDRGEPPLRHGPADSRRQADQRRGARARGHRRRRARAAARRKSRHPGAGDRQRTHAAG